VVNTASSEDGQFNEREKVGHGDDQDLALVRLGDAAEEFSYFFDVWLC
jgi:hypothetical protein